MKTSAIPKALINDIRLATEDIYRYDRFDRFALIVVLTAAESNSDVEDIFLKQAKLALQRHPVKKKLVAA